MSKKWSFFLTIGYHHAKALALLFITVKLPLLESSKQALNSILIDSRDR